MPGRAPAGVPITTLRLKPVDDEGRRQYELELLRRERRNANIIKNENDPRNIGGTGGRSRGPSARVEGLQEVSRMRERQTRERRDENIRVNSNDPRNIGGNRKVTTPTTSTPASAPKYDKATRFAIGLAQMGQATRDYKKLNSIKASSPPKAAEKVKTTGSALSSLKEDMKTSAKVVRGGRDYMGETFDATLRRGVSKGRDYLKSQLAKDNVSEKEQKAMLGRFEAKFAKDQALTSKEDGLVAGYEKGGDAKRLLDAYRKKGGYRKNATADEVASLARGK
jgi:hypothetical protein